MKERVKALFHLTCVQVVGGGGGINIILTHF